MEKYTKWDGIIDGIINYYGSDKDEFLRVYGKVKAYGNLDGDALKRLLILGIPMIDCLCEYHSKTEEMEVTSAEMYERISKGFISYFAFADTLEYLHDSTCKKSDTYAMFKEVLAITIQHHGIDTISGVQKDILAEHLINSIVTLATTMDEIGKGNKDEQLTLDSGQTVKK